MQLIIDDAKFKEFVREVVREELSKQNESKKEPEVCGMAYFREGFCDGKPPEWVTQFIFTEFRDEIDWHLPGGWLIPSRGTGVPWRVIVKPARAWFEKNYNRINWEGRLIR